MLVNLQKRYVAPSASLGAFVRTLKRRLRLGKQGFNVCLVDDSAIRHLNVVYRGKDKATDVLSFPWNEAGRKFPPEPRAPSFRRDRHGIKNFLGEVVISVEMARRNASVERHSTLNELRWLILHGVLHLLGYDHERDSGEMVALELSLREQMGIAGERRDEKQVRRQNAKVKRQKFG